MTSIVNLGDSLGLNPYYCALELAILLIFSFFGYLLLASLLKQFASTFVRAGFSGVDLNKPLKPTIPEAQGVIAGVVFLMIMFLFIPVPFWPYLSNAGQTLPGSNNVTISHDMLVGPSNFKSQFIHYLAGLLCICCMIFLGFADDALDLRWRHKIFLPTLSSLPLLMVYFANEGTTLIVVPVLVRPLIGPTVDIGFFYYLYMGVLTVFCTNAINIYAGINGLEVGQSLVIGLSIIIFNVFELKGRFWQAHLFSLYFLIPFVIVCMTLIKANWYPAEIFVGDTFCYFSGMLFAVVGILGHFSKTLLLFLIPQLANFALSIPQLFKIFPCPRHRIPSYCPETGLLKASTITLHEGSLSTFGLLCLRVAFFLRMARRLPPSCLGDKDRTTNIELTNMTLINLVLSWFGSRHEAILASYLILLQIAASICAFMIRYPIADYFYYSQ